MTSVEQAHNITDVAPDTTPRLAKNSAAFVGLQLGLINHIDIYANEAFGGPVFAGVKLQLVGDPFKDAKSGNFSFSVAGGVASGNVTESQGTDTATSTKSSSDATFGGYEAMVIMGYRPSDWTLIYVSPFTSHITAKTKIQQSTAGVATVTAQPDGQGDMKGASAGLRFGKYFFVNGEVSITETKWKRMKPTVYETEKFSNVALGVALGGAW